MKDVACIYSKEEGQLCTDYTCIDQFETFDFVEPKSSWKFEKVVCK